MLEYCIGPYFAILNTIIDEDGLTWSEPICCDNSDNRSLFNTKAAAEKYLENMRLEGKNTVGLSVQEVSISYRR